MNNFKACLIVGCSIFSFNEAQCDNISYGNGVGQNQYSTTYNQIAHSRVEVNEQNGALGLNIPVGTLIGNDGLGPGFKLNLLYSQAGLGDQFIGRHWYFNIPVFNKETDYMHLTSGESFQVKDGGMIPYKKLKDLYTNLLTNEVNPGSYGQVFDKNGSIISYSDDCYNGLCPVTSISNIHGNSLYFYYSNEGNLLGITDQILSVGEVSSNLGCNAMSGQSIKSINICWSNEVITITSHGISKNDTVVTTLKYTTSQSNNIEYQLLNTIEKQDSSKYEFIYGSSDINLNLITQISKYSPQVNGENYLLNREYINYTSLGALSLSESTDTTPTVPAVYQRIIVAQNLSDIYAEQYYYGSLPKIDNYSPSNPDVSAYSLVNNYLGFNGNTSSYSENVDVLFNQSNTYTYQSGKIFFSNVELDSDNLISSANIVRASNTTYNRFNLPLVKNDYINGYADSESNWYKYSTSNYIYQPIVSESGISYLCATPTSQDCLPSNYKFPIKIDKTLFGMKYGYNEISTYSSGYTQTKLYSHDNYGNLISATDNYGINTYVEYLPKENNFIRYPSKHYSIPVIIKNQVTPPAYLSTYIYRDTLTYDQLSNGSNTKECNHLGGGCYKSLVLDIKSYSSQKSNAYIKSLQNGVVQEKDILISDDKTIPMNYEVHTYYEGKLDQDYYGSPKLIANILLPTTAVKSAGITPLIQSTQSYHLYNLLSDNSEIQHKNILINENVSVGKENLYVLADGTQLKCSSLSVCEVIYSDKNKYDVSTKDIVSSSIKSIFNLFKLSDSYSGGAINNEYYLNNQEISSVTYSSPKVNGESKIQNTAHYNYCYNSQGYIIRMKTLPGGFHAKGAKYIGCLNKVYSGYKEASIRDGLGRIIIEMVDIPSSLTSPSIENISFSIDDNLYPSLSSTYPEAFDIAISYNMLPIKSYTYNDLNQKISETAYNINPIVHKNDSSVESYIKYYNYDPTGALLSTVFPDGTATVTTKDYEPSLNRKIVYLLGSSKSEPVDPILPKNALCHYETSDQIQSSGCKLISMTVIDKNKGNKISAKYSLPIDDITTGLMPLQSSKIMYTKDIIKAAKEKISSNNFLGKNIYTYDGLLRVITQTQLYYNSFSDMSSAKSETTSCSASPITVNQAVCYNSLKTNISYSDDLSQKQVTQPDGVITVQNYNGHKQLIELNVAN